MLSQGVGSWLQIDNTSVCIPLPHLTPLILVALPIALWVAHHTVATLWSELVKHVLRRRIWLDELKRTKAAMATLEAVMAQRDAQAEVERKLMEKLIRENDRLLMSHIRKAVSALLMPPPIGISPVGNDLAKSSDDTLDVV